MERSSSLPALRLGIPGPCPPIGGGGGVSAPLAICQISGPVLDPKTAFDSSGLEFSEYVAKFI